MLNVAFHKIHPDAVAPRRSYPTDAGFDLVSVEDVFLQPGKVTKIRTGLVFAIPSGFYGQIAPRSGLATKGITVYGGVIDPGYRGEIIVLLHWVSSEQREESWFLPKGMRVAQLLILPRYLGDFVESTQVVESEQSERGANGFGSTGVMA